MALAEVPHDREELVDAVEVAEAATRTAEPEVLIDGELRKDSPPFGHERDPGAGDVLGRASDDRIAVQTHVAAVRRNESHHRMQRR